MAGKYLKKIPKRKSRLLMLGALVSALLLALTFSGAAGEDQKVWVVSYGDQDTTVTSSQLMEVKTSGFADNACLIYNYDNQTNTYSDQLVYSYIPQINRLYVFPSTDTYNYEISDRAWDGISGLLDWVISGDTTFFDTDTVVDGVSLRMISKYNSGCWTTSKFMALTYREDPTGYITVIVADCNPESSTYGKSAEYSFTPGEGNLGKDVNGGVAVMFAGENMPVREVLCRMGVPHMTANLTEGTQYRSEIFDWEISRSLTGLKCTTETLYVGALKWIVDDMNIQLNPTQAGYFTANMEIEFGDMYGISSYFYTNTMETPMLETFDTYARFEVYDHKPVVTTKGYCIELSDTIAGYVYSVNDVYQTAQYDDQVLTFGTAAEPLLDGMNYNLSMSSNNSNHMSKYDWQVYNNAPSTVQWTFDPNTEGYGTATVTWYYGQKFYDGLARSTEFPGQDFLYWAENRDGTGINYSTTNPAIYDATTFYAIWDLREYSADISVYLNDALHSGDTVTLYQGGALKYTLTDDGDGTYSHTAIHYVNDGENGWDTYDIYVNGVDSGVDISWDGQQDDGASTMATVYSYDGNIDLQYNVASLAGQAVYVTDGTNTYYATYQNELYNVRAYYTAQKDDITAVDWNIYVNGIKATYDEVDTTVTMFTKTVPVINFYTVTVNAYVDGNTTNNDSLTVTLQQNGIDVYRATYQSDKTYQTPMIMDDGTDFNIKAKGFDSEGATTEMVDYGNQVADVHYYTIQFVDGENTATVYRNYTLILNDTYVISNRVMDGSRSFSHWSTSIDGDAIEYAIGETVTVSKTITYYAVWLVPTVIIGDYYTADNQMYTMPFLVMFGFQEDAGSVFQMQITCDSTSSSITMPTALDGMTMTWTGTYQVLCDMPNGITPDVAEAFLRQVVITPGFTNAIHTCTVDVWGTTIEVVT